MTDPAPLLAAICDDPDDVVSRLVYADWLDENGDLARGAHDHAELIRLQIALSGRDLDDPATRPQVLRERQLRKRLNPRLKDEVRAGRDAVYHNGFIEGLTLTITEFLHHAPALFARIPLRRVRFCRSNLCKATLADLLASPHLARLRTINLCYGRFDDDELRQFAHCPHLNGLHSLCLEWHQIADVRVLAEAAFFPNLRVLDLSNCRINDEGVAALLGSAKLSRLEELNLRDNRLTAAGVRAVAEANCLARLRALDLSGNGVPAEGVAALVTSVPLAGLERLTLQHVRDSAALARAFAAASRPGRLRWLLLSPGGYPPAPGVGDEGASALAAAPWLANLRTLHLADNGIGAAGVRAIASTSTFANLHTLGLADNPIGNLGAQWLAESRHLANLRSLRLRGCRIDVSGAKALAASSYLGALELLDLKDNPVRQARVKALHERFGSALRLTDAKP